LGVGGDIICQNALQRPRQTMNMPLTLDDIRHLDTQDPLREFREQFLFPAHGEGHQTYLCGNSLGLQPRSASQAVQREMQAWAERGVEGHFQGERPWTRQHETLRAPLAALCGADGAEVTTMNTLTVNLHLLMAAFYRPSGRRSQIVIERQAFPSDRYAAASQIRWHGLDPADHLVEIGAGHTALIDESELENYLETHGEQVALVLWPGVQYASGQAFDLARITRAAHAAGAMAGFDLAHAIGNIPLALHEDGPDFAAWCTYKYLNAGPGAIAGAFVHQRHHDRSDLTRLEGWWGVGLDRRFLMEPAYQPAGGADAWQLSTPPTLAVAPLEASLDIFAQAGFNALRGKSRALTDTLERLIQEQLDDVLEILTPANPDRRGCQLSLRVRSGREAGRRLFDRLVARGVIGDWREPDIIRVAPVPLYNRFEDCWELVRSCRV